VLWLLAIGIHTGLACAVLGELLCVHYLKNHVFLGTKIDQLTAAHDFFEPAMHNCAPLPVVQASKVIGTKKRDPQSLKTPRS
jgi:hypothetical protein